MSKKHKNLNKYIHQKAFTSPGSLVYVGKEVAESSIVKLIEFNSEFIVEKQVKQMNDCKPAPSKDYVTWLDVDGIHETQVIEAIGKHYNLHPLLLEDVLNTEQKPKLEHFDDNSLFVVLKMLHFSNERVEFDTEHVGLVLGQDYVISFQEIHKTDVFQPIHERLKTSIGKTRKGKADYLFYSLLDLVVDNYYVSLEEFGDVLEDLEIQIIENAHSNQQTRLYQLRRELMQLRKSILPIRDIVGMLMREDSGLIGNPTQLYLRDVYDHVLQIIETVESYRDLIENIQNIYLTSISNKMNSVMKTLTVFTAIFMPLTFIAGIYGMNFDNMPELKHPMGYFYTLGSMAAIAIGLWIYFKWKKYV
ncbi:MAG: magnesium/cobalt transporter CorA [Spirosomaceae bacterium]|jgi:magnesium transporter|nr:magnesium/cobalt transporter CorA [Spirosomataceae bacterium]